MKKIFIALCMLFAVTFGLSAKQYVTCGGISKYGNRVYSEIKDLIEAGYHIDQVVLIEENGSTSSYVIVYSDNE